MSFNHNIYEVFNLLTLEKVFNFDAIAVKVGRLKVGCFEGVHQPAGINVWMKFANVGFDVFLKDVHVNAIGKKRFLNVEFLELAKDHLFLVNLKILDLGHSLVGSVNQIFYFAFAGGRE